MSDSSNKMKRAILPVVIAAAALQLPVAVQANTVRIMGPADQVDEPAQPPTPAVSPAPSPRPAVTQPRVTTPRPVTAPVNRSVGIYGPTGENETLWSIASRYKPNDSVSIYQVLGAIFRANPNAFTDNNIHGLIPGSRLRMPTMAQIQAENTDQIRNRVESDLQRREQTRARTANTPAGNASRPASPQTATAGSASASPAAPAPKPAATAPQVSASRPATAAAAPERSAASAVSSPAPAVGVTAAAASRADDVLPSALQEQLDSSDEALTQLRESNQLLRVRLSEMQHEIGALKEQLAGDEELRGEIQSFIAQQKAQQSPLDAPLTEQPPVHWLDKLAANPWALAGAALIPGSLIAGLLAFFAGRRRKEDEAASPAAEVSKDVPKPVASDLDDDEPHLGLDSEDSSLDDLFDDKTPQDDSIFSDNLFDDNDAELDELDLTDGLDDAFGNELPKSDISVKSNDQAIGLQDMERALDQIDQAPAPSPEKEDSLSGLWDKPFSAQDNEETDFDLAVGLLDDEDVSPAKPVEDKRNDDLFDAFADSELTGHKADSIELGMLDQDILNELMQDFEREDDEQHAPVSPAVNNIQADSTRDDSAEEDWGLDDLNADFNLDASSTELLDELIDERESDADSDFELDENSTALLDELLDEETPNTQIDPELDTEENADEDKDVFDELLTLDDEEPQDAESSWLTASQEENTLSTDDIDDLIFAEKKTVDEHLSELDDTETLAELSEAYPERMADGDDPVLSGTEPPVSDAGLDDAGFHETDTDTDAPDAERMAETASETAASAAADEADEPATVLDSEPEVPVISDERVAETSTPQDDLDSLLSDAQTDDVVAAEADRPDFAPELRAEDEIAETENSEAQKVDSEETEVADTVPERIDSDPTDVADESVLHSEASVADSQDHEPEPGAETSSPQSSEYAAPDVAAEPDQALSDTALAENPESETAPWHHNSDEASQLIEQNRYQKAVQADQSRDDAPLTTPLAAAGSAVADEPAPSPEPDAAAEQPEATLDPAWEEAVAGRQEPVFNLDEFPEFDEEAALLDPEAVAWEDDAHEKDWSDDDAQAALNKVSEQLQLAAQAVERNGGLTESQPKQDASALSETASLQETDSHTADLQEPGVQESGLQENSGQAVPMHGKPQYEYAVIDPATLPEFDEDDALNASFEEQMELEQYEQELKYGEEAQFQPEPEPASPLQPQPQSNEAWRDELIDSAGLDMAALLAEPELDLPAMQAVEDLQSDETLPSIRTQDGTDTELTADAEWPRMPDDSHQSENIQADNIQSENPQTDNVRADSEPSDDVHEIALAADGNVAEPQYQAEPQAELDNAEEFEHEQWLLHDSVPLSELEEQELSPEESAIWGADIPEPELESEDWGEQPSLSEQADDVMDGPESAQADSQLIASARDNEPYISIDELMKELEGESDPELDSAPLKLDVGLDEFPDVLAGIGEIDVDGAGEYASKLDLAKAYLEMNDTDGAFFLLEDVAENGDGDVSREAANLLLKMDR